MGKVEVPIAEANNTKKSSIYAVTLKPVELPKLLVQINGRVIEALLDLGTQSHFYLMRL